MTLWIALGKRVSIKSGSLIFLAMVSDTARLRLMIKPRWGFVGLLNKIPRVQEPWASDQTSLRFWSAGKKPHEYWAKGVAANSRSQARAIELPLWGIKTEGRKAANRRQRLLIPYQLGRLQPVLFSL